MLLPITIGGLLFTLLIFDSSTRPRWVILKYKLTSVIEALWLLEYELPIVIISLVLIGTTNPFKYGWKAFLYVPLLLYSAAPRSRGIGQSQGRTSQLFHSPCNDSASPRSSISSPPRLRIAHRYAGTSSRRFGSTPALRCRTYSSLTHTCSPSCSLVSVR